MNLRVILTFFMIHGLAQGEEGKSIEPYDCKGRLLDSGCDEKGSLLDENVCINSDYMPSKPPKFSTTVHVGFLKWPRILDIDEGLKTIKVQLDDAIFQWEDARVKINFNHIEKKKLVRPILPPPKPFLLLKVPLGNICTYLIDEMGRTMIWTPEQLHIKNFISSKIDNSRNPWGILEFGIRFSDPFNESEPLINLRIKLIVTIECRFNYRKYPIDSQKCGLRFASDSLKRLIPVLSDPLGICSQSNEGYEVNGFHVSSACSDAGVDFFLERDITVDLFQHYLPSAIIVLVSQTSFVIPLSATPGRIGLVVTLFLALTNIFMNQQVMST